MFLAAIISVFPFLVFFFCFILILGLIYVDRVTEKILKIAYWFIWKAVLYQLFDFVFYINCLIVSAMLAYNFHPCWPLQFSSFFTKGALAIIHPFQMWSLCVFWRSGFVGGFYSKFISVRYKWRKWKQELGKAKTCVHYLHFAFNSYF